MHSSVYFYPDEAGDEIEKKNTKLYELFTYYHFTEHNVIYASISEVLIL